MIARSIASAMLWTVLLGLHDASAAGSAPDSTARNIRGRARSRVSVPPPANTPRHPRLALWLDAATQADSAMVMRLDIRPRGTAAPGAAPAEWNTRVESSSTVGRDWIARFVKRLSVQSAFDPSGSCVPASDSSSRNDQLILGVRFGSGDQARSAIALFREHCVELEEGATAVGRAELEPADRQLVALAREALPGDEVVRRLSESLLLARPNPDPPAQRSSAPQPVIVSPGSQDTPKLGDYVYVEELPEAITKVPPQYPDEARKAGVDGTVMMQALVGKDGKVKDVRVQKSIPLLDAAAVACVSQWIFKPALSKGEPVAVWVAIPVRFTLH